MKKILICTEVEATREVFKLMLGDLHDLILVENCQSAVDVLKTSQVGLILIETNGDKKETEQIEQLREQNTKLHITLIGNNKTESILKKIVENNAADNYILKPLRSGDIENIGKIVKS
jgi:CheY-like chemotaxis protein